MNTTKAVTWGVGVIVGLMVSVILFAGVMASIGAAGVLLRGMFFLGFLSASVVFVWSLYKIGIKRFIHRLITG